MKDKKQDGDFKATTEDAGTGNKEGIETDPRSHHSGSGNDGSFNEMLQKENQIDPGNEHHHIDAGGEGTATTAHEPGAVKNNEAGTNGAGS